MKSNYFRSYINLSVVLLVSVTHVPAIAQGTTTPGAARPPELTVRVYSGRPNPTTTLSAEELEALMTLIQKTSVDTSARAKELIPSMEGGYAGFVVAPLSGPFTGTYRVITVYRNWIEIREFSIEERKSTAEYRADPNKTVEQHLANLVDAKGQLDPTIKQRIQSGADFREKQMANTPKQ